MLFASWDCPLWAKRHGRLHQDTHACASASTPTHGLIQDTPIHACSGCGNAMRACCRARSSLRQFAPCRQSALQSPPAHSQPRLRLLEPPSRTMLHGCLPTGSTTTTWQGGTPTAVVLWASSCLHRQRPAHPGRVKDPEWSHDHCINTCVIRVAVCSGAPCCSTPVHSHTYPKRAAAASLTGGPVSWAPHQSSSCMGLHSTRIGDHTCNRDQMPRHQRLDVA